MKYKYHIKYTNRDGKEIHAIRWASCSQAAFELYARQYGYGVKYHLVDAETRGLTACEGYFCEAFNGNNPFAFVTVTAGA